jgi:hypothetical protein
MERFHSGSWHIRFLSLYPFFYLVCRKANSRKGWQSADGRETESGNPDFVGGADFF